MKGLCKDEFEKWFETNIYQDVDCDSITRLDLTEAFWTQPPSMQIGVLIDYFDSVGITISVIPYKAKGGMRFISNAYGESNEERGEISTTRTEARAKAIDKACELRNKQLEEVIKVSHI